MENVGFLNVFGKNKCDETNGIVEHLHEFGMWFLILAAHQNNLGKFKQE